MKCQAGLELLLIISFIIVISISLNLFLIRQSQTIQNKDYLFAMKECFKVSNAVSSSLKSLGMSVAFETFLNITINASSNLIQVEFNDEIYYCSLMSKKVYDSMNNLEFELEAGLYTAINQEQGVSII